MASVRRLTEEAKGQILEVMEKFYRETSVKYKALLDELHMEYTHPHHGTLKATYAEFDRYISGSNRRRGGNFICRKRFGH
jgi:hypothetical protein